MAQAQPADPFPLHRRLRLVQHRQVRHGMVLIRLSDWTAMSPAFGDGSAKVDSADVRPQTITVLHAEPISSQRVRLMRLAGRPVSCDLLRMCRRARSGA